MEFEDNMLADQTKELYREKRALELQEEFDEKGFVVVRRELLSHQREPAIIIRPNGFAFNKACINGLEDVYYINLMINPEKKYLVARQCDENAKDSVRWCKVDKEGNRNSRKITSKILCGMLYELMQWDVRYRYKILGYKIKVQDERIFIFDLKDTEKFIEDKKKAKEELEKIGMSLEEINALVPEKGLPRAFYPPDWRTSFGIPLPEHNNVFKIEDIDDFVGTGEITATANDKTEKLVLE